MPWAIPPLWPGQTVAILASGPSMSAEVAAKVRAAGVPVIAINSTFRLAPWASMLYAADRAWWAANPEAMKFAGIKVSCERYPGVESLRNAGTIGYTDDAWGIHTYGNSGAQGIQIAAKAGASRILLCGFDMHDRAGSHWHGDHPAPLRNTQTELYARWIVQMAVLARHLAERGVDVLNVTPDSALKCWPIVDLEAALAPRPVLAA